MQTDELNLKELSMRTDEITLIPVEHAILDFVTNDEALVVEIDVRDARLNVTPLFTVMDEEDNREHMVHSEPATKNGRRPGALFGWILLNFGLCDSTVAAHLIRAFSMIEGCDWARDSAVLAHSTILTEDFGQEQEGLGPVWCSTGHTGDNGCLMTSRREALRCIHRVAPHLATV
jgi:hypothetical protein